MTTMWTTSDVREFPMISSHFHVFDLQTQHFHNVSVLPSNPIAATLTQLVANKGFAKKNRKAFFVSTALLTEHRFESGIKIKSIRFRKRMGSPPRIWIYCSQARVSQWIAVGTSGLEVELSRAGISAK
ncbi:MAG: hypothetical protein U0798_01185 [Gemmataceae bacterium]